MNLEELTDGAREYLAEYGFTADEVSHAVMVLRPGGLWLEVTVYMIRDGQRVLTPLGLHTITHSFRVYEFPEWLGYSTYCCGDC